MHKVANINPKGDVKFVISHELDNKGKYLLNNNKHVEENIIPL